MTPPYSGIGRRPVAKYPDPARSVKALVIEAGRGAAERVQWREGSRPGTGRRHRGCGARPVLGAGRMARHRDRAGPVLALRPARLHPADNPGPWLAKLRWRIEHDYREMKQALGLAHFEGRTFNGWHHHVTLVSLAHAFCALRRLATAQKTRRRPEPLPSRP
ncbi:transposase [Streptomyces sp. NPDC127112]|uniref:transposase n=1 Tax=Streptomyces sp. NPDC127112 TaxID=3345364 RepID=UPI0036425428